MLALILCAALFSRTAWAATSKTDYMDTDFAGLSPSARSAWKLGWQYASAGNAKSCAQSYDDKHNFRHSNKGTVLPYPSPFACVPTQPCGVERGALL